MAQPHVGHGGVSAGSAAALLGVLAIAFGCGALYLLPRDLGEIPRHLD